MVNHDLLTRCASVGVPAHRYPSHACPYWWSSVHSAPFGPWDLFLRGETLRVTERRIPPCGRRVPTHRWREQEAPPTLLGDVNPSSHSFPHPLPARADKGYARNDLSSRLTPGLSRPADATGTPTGELHRQVDQPRRITRRSTLRWLLRRIFHWSKEHRPCQGPGRCATANSRASRIRWRCRPAGHRCLDPSKVSLDWGLMSGWGALGNHDRSRGGRGSSGFAVQPEAQCAGQDARHRQG